MIPPMPVRLAVLLGMKALGWASPMVRKLLAGLLAQTSSRIFLPSVSPHCFHPNQVN